MRWDTTSARGKANVQPDAAAPSKPHQLPAHYGETAMSRTLAAQQSGGILDELAAGKGRSHRTIAGRAGTPEEEAAMVRAGVLRSLENALEMQEHLESLRTEQAAAARRS